MTSNRICSVDRCELPHRARGLCAKHYTTAWARALRPTRTRKCSVGDCGEPHSGHGFCMKHYTRWRRHGDPEAVLSGEIHPQWLGDDAKYRTIHKRLAVNRGPAAGYQCADCGKSADQWSYDNECPNERLSETGHWYTADQDHYEPRCRPCHKRFDIADSHRRDGDLIWHGKAMSDELKAKLGRE